MVPTNIFWFFIKQLIFYVDKRENDKQKKYEVKLTGTEFQESNPNKPTDNPSNPDLNSLEELLGYLYCSEVQCFHLWYSKPLSHILKINSENACASTNTICFNDDARQVQEIYITLTA